MAIQESPVYLPGTIAVLLYYIFSKQYWQRKKTQRQREREGENKLIGKVGCNVEKYRGRQRDKSSSMGVLKK